MRKLYLYILILLLTFIGSKSFAQTWDFNVISTADIANLTADTQNWTHEETSSNNRFKNETTYSVAPLMANGTELETTKGLLFSVSVADGVRIDVGGQRVALNKTSTITVQNVKAGSVVTMVCKTSSKSEARGIDVTNITPVSGSFNATSMDQVTNVGTVIADGDITFTNSQGGMYLYSIKIADASESEGSGATDKTGNAVSLDPTKNQVKLSLNNNDVKYYNTSNITSIDIDEANNVKVNSADAAESDEYNGTVTSISFAKAADTGTGGDIDNQAGCVVINEAKGWKESAYIEWTPFQNATSYNVYIKGGQYSEYTKLDDQLVRDYGTYGRADAVGLMAGSNYAFKVVPVINESEAAASASEATALEVVNYDRGGFAHFNRTEGVGAYNNDGTLKAGAHVVYVTAKTAKTVSLQLTTGTYTGFQDIIYGYQKGKGNEKPLAVRIVGKISDTDMDEFGSSAEGLQVKGSNSYSNMNITIEGIGEDATISGFGILTRNCSSVEYRNFAVMLCMDDCISLDTDNSHIWVHNIDFFYGKTGGDSDQAKGDGTVDMKGGTKNVTISYNHFWDSGKASLCGMGGDGDGIYNTYHHNWFDHSDSRHPRVREMSIHVYNNYFDGVSKYGVGVTTGSSTFVENNYFRGTKRPMMSSKQGTDATGDGTFSGEAGGMIKSFGNIFTERTSKFSYITHKDNATSFDAYEAESRNEQVPSTYKTLSGGTTYNNFDTNSGLIYAYTPDDAADVPANVTGYFGAGRLNHGDFTWDFTGTDENYDVDTELKNALINYKSSLVKIFGDENATSGETGSEGSGDNTGGESGDNTGGESGGNTGGSDISGEIACHFQDKAPSNAAFTVSGNYSDSKGSATVNGTTYTTCLKIESKTEIRFTVSKPMQLTLVFGDGEAASIKINGTAYTSTSSILTQTVEAGEIVLTKKNTGNLYYISLSEVSQ